MNIPCGSLDLIDSEVESMESQLPETNSNSEDYVYTCPFASYECTFKVCMIHGKHTEQEIAARIAAKWSRYDPANPLELRELKTCLGQDITWEAPQEFHADTIVIPPAPAPTVFLIDNMNGGNIDTSAIATTSEGNCSKSQITPENPSKLSEHHHETEDMDLLADGLWKPSKKYVLEGNKGGYVSFSTIPDDNDYVDPVFANEAKRHREILANHSHTKARKSSRVPLMFQYGIRYAPDPYPASIPVSRTITMTGFADDIPISDIMARIRGGQVISVTEAWSPEPVGRTVVVKFRDSTAASEYVNYVLRNIASIFDDGIRVSLVKANTYPTEPELIRDISNGFTRLIVFLDFAEHCPLSFLDDLESMYADPEDVLEDLWVQKGSLYLLFKSTAFASKFYKDFVWEREQAEPGSYDNGSYRFAQDPCSQPLRGLQKPFRPARYPNQSWLQKWIERRCQSTTSLNVQYHGVNSVQVTSRGDGDDDREIMEYEVPIPAEELDEPSPQPTSLLDSPIDEITYEKFPAMTEYQTEFALIDFSTDEDEDEKDIPKSKLPQDDPAYFDSLSRDSFDMVSVSEVGHSFSKE
ncbi:uncharacterized protein F4812DRAFT_69499 [Daldinia caldariorum]|uniref:uncharacterized protein n=1 Tax=Daldinia caldariorum TaxID=326644 RepID=UPI002008D705|nr:uncharacterized protein F4812DRAFT_69499 [Daldinia caldariorum]KAI1466881.1 hypothetical protein F4812DRAFT_69499 [Daldinia caldariorum]